VELAHPVVKRTHVYHAAGLQCWFRAVIRSLATISAGRPSI
jgi:hypothetical protein